MAVQWSVDGTEAGGESCCIRRRHTWPRHSSVVYEAVRQQGGKLQVVASTRHAPIASPTAAAALLTLTDILRRQDWVPTSEALFLGDDVIACFTRAAATSHHACR